MTRAALVLATGATALAMLAEACSPTAALHGDGGGVDAAIDAPEAPDAPAEDGIDPDPPGKRDWTQAPAIVEMDAVADLWIVGDVHGDYTRLAALLDTAGLAAPASEPAAAQWEAGDATLVFVGDLINKGKAGLPVIGYVRALAASAQAAGGRVVVLMGNHEANFLAYPNGQMAQDFATELRQAGLDPRAVARGEAGPGAWLRALPIGLRVGDFFVIHAGNTKGRTLEDLRKLVEQGVDAAGFAAGVLSAPDSILETPLQPHPWWEIPGYDGETILAKWAQALGARRFVQGHDPGEVTFSDGKKRRDGEMFQRFGRVFLVDVGMSSAINESQGAILHARLDGTGKTTVTAVHADGTVTPLWTGW
jgi:hypothetical protein